MNLPPQKLGLSPSSARDWLTTHLLHAACPLLYCVSTINTLARLTRPTVINACLLEFVKGGYCVGGMLSERALRLLCDKSWFLKVKCLLTTRHGTSEARLLNVGRRGRRRRFKGAVALTDLFSRTSPAESHLSETLPAVRGLEWPDKKNPTESKVIKLRARGSNCVFAVVLQAMRHASPFKYRPLAYTHFHAFVFCTRVCVLRYE